MSRLHAEIDRTARPGPAPVAFRRRRTDWIRTAPGGMTESAAVEVAKAALAAYDEATMRHSGKVAVLSEAIAEQLGLAGDVRADLLSAAELHDIGKLGIPESVLQKPGPLTEAEWSCMREHTIIGERILKLVPGLGSVPTVVRHSHEHWDGSGYPDALAGEQIPLASRIVLCADAFDAIRSDRPYRVGRSASEALVTVGANSGSQFDPVVAAALEPAVAALGIDSL